MRVYQPSAAAPLQSLMPKIAGPAEERNEQRMPANKQHAGERLRFQQPIYMPTSLLDFLCFFFFFCFFFFLRRLMVPFHLNQVCVVKAASLAKDLGVKSAGRRSVLPLRTYFHILPLVLSISLSIQVTNSHACAGFLFHPTPNRLGVTNLAFSPH
ncbi:hypothetical protein T01_12411 [Trichinella spiralis]|uniref:Uncharacterized protein n=1 Tax=Trichinella spiralis TaxID=6334 RepID=A0A0V1AV12_TRISP|nr:hypothetical protein T01_12079 [Trichinella spiralis]KRY28140.1 hypothetical protein T01_12411 [Trichinella spiralis]